MNQCVKCLKPTNNPKFCSLSCAASFNNKIYTKRKKTTPLVCSNCGSAVSQRRKHAKHCKNCRPNYGADITIKEAIYTESGKQNTKTLIRYRARQLALKTGMTKCMNCGYDKHVEICHIKPVSSFPETAMVSEVNDLTNLIALCPNCHWEFDHP